MNKAVLYSNLKEIHIRQERIDEAIVNICSNIEIKNEYDYPVSAIKLGVMWNKLEALRVAYLSLLEKELKTTKEKDNFINLFDNKVANNKAGRLWLIENGYL